MAKQPSNPPETTFRLGLVSASVFVNEIETDDGTKEIRNVNLQRRYKDNGDWKSKHVVWSLGPAAGNACAAPRTGAHRTR